MQKLWVIDLIDRIYFFDGMASCLEKSASQRKRKNNRYCSGFNIDHFKEELDDKMKSGTAAEFSNFQNIFI